MSSEVALGVVFSAIAAAAVALAVSEDMVMTGWYPGWLVGLAWLTVTAFAAFYFFGPAARIVEALTRASRAIA